MNKKRVTRIFGVVALIVIVLTAGFWFYYSPEKPNMALLCVLAGVVILFNILVSYFFISKNLKEK